MTDPVSIVFASVALVVSVASATWNVASHRLTGQHPKLNVRAMHIIRPGRKTLLEVVQIEVSNHGRVPLKVTNWTITFPPDSHFIAVQADFLSGFERVVCSNQPEVTVPAGDNTTFYYPMHHIRTEVARKGFDLREAYVQVYFAAHKPLRTKPNLEMLIMSNSATAIS